MYKIGDVLQTRKCSLVQHNSHMLHCVGYLSFVRKKYFILNIKHSRPSANSNTRVENVSHGGFFLTNLKLTQEKRTKGAVFLLGVKSIQTITTVWELVLVLLWFAIGLVYLVSKRFGLGFTHSIENRWKNGLGFSTFW